MCSEIDFLDADWFLGLTGAQQNAAMQLFARAEKGVFAACNWRAFCAKLRRGSKVVSATLAALVVAGRAQWEAGMPAVRLLPSAPAVSAEAERQRRSREARQEQTARKVESAAPTSPRNAPSETVTFGPAVTAKPVTEASKSVTKAVTAFFSSDNQISESESDQISESDSLYKISESDQNPIQRVLPDDLSAAGREMLAKYSAEVIAEAERRMTEKGEPLWKKKYLALTCRTVKNEWDAGGQQAMPLPMMVRGGRAEPAPSPAPRTESKAEARPGPSANCKVDEPCQHKPPMTALKMALNGHFAVEAFTQQEKTA